MIPYLNALDVTGLPPAWRDPIADYQTGVATRLVHALESVGLSPYAGHDLRTIADIQSRNAPRMKRLAEPCNPELNPHHSDRDTVVVTLQRFGRPVGCTALRLFWIEDSLKQAIETNGLCERPPNLGDSGFVCIAPTALEARSCPLIWSCGSFVEEGEDPIAFPAMIRLAYLLGFVLWRWQWLAGICDAELAKSGVFDRDRGAWVFRTLGMSRIENGVSRIEPDGKRTRYELVAAHRQEFRRLALHPSYGDPTTRLADPAEIGDMK